MRDLLETFRLPGESQQINRITETFAEIYFATEPGAYFLKPFDLLLIVRAAEVKSQDAVYVLAYSIIMLNTDLHNPQIRVSLCILLYNPTNISPRNGCQLRIINGIYEA